MVRQFNRVVGQQQKTAMSKFEYQDQALEELARMLFSKIDEPTLGTEFLEGSKLDLASIALTILTLI